MTTKYSISTILWVRIALVAIIAFGCLSAERAAAATLSVTPGTGVYSTGGTFSARVVVNTEGKPINAAEATITFDPNTLSVVSVAKGSIFNLWTVEPSFSNTAGTVSFGGGSPTGYTGSAGTILTVTFRAKTAGTAKVGLTKGSVLAADGLGTNVLRSQSGGTYTLSAAAASPEPEVVIEYVPPANTPAAPRVTSASHPDPETWYRETTATLTFDVPSDVTAMRTLLSPQANAVPTKVYETPQSSLTLTDLEEGIQYFHIQFQNAEGWGRIAHYRLAIDRTNPSAFIIEYDKDDRWNPTPTLHFAVDDATSPVTRYAISIDNAPPYEFIDTTGSSTHTLAPLAPGSHSLIVEAFDAAGNSITATAALTIEAFDKPVFTEYPPRLNDEVIPVIKGTTKPRAAVAVTVRKLGVSESQSDANITYEVVADESGIFTVIPDGRLTNGVYELTAIATDEAGARSEPSDPVRMVVEEPGFLRVGGLVVDALSVLIPLLALLALLVAGLVYAKRRWLVLRGRVIKEAHEAGAILERRFEELSDMLESRQKDLAAARKSGKLTKQEHELFTELAAEIDAAHTAIAKEIADIDRVAKP